MLALTTHSLLIFLACFIIVPIWVYILVRLGAAGFFRSKREASKQQEGKEQ